jgi:hypothetical protein
MNRSFVAAFALGVTLSAAIFSGSLDSAVSADGKAALVTPPSLSAPQTSPAETQRYENLLTPICDPKPLLADFPQYVEPICERNRFEAPILVDDADGNLEVRAWRWSYNARAIIEMPNRLRGKETAIIVVHPWGVDDEWGWKVPQPHGVADFGPPEKNNLAARHTREVIDPFLKRLRGETAFVMYSLPGPADPIRTKVYRSFTKTPTRDERAQGERELKARLGGFRYQAGGLPRTLTLHGEMPVKDYFRQFPGLDAGAHYNGPGYWDLPIPVSTSLTVEPSDVVVFDDEGYNRLRDFLKANGVRHILLTGYSTDLCFRKTTAGYENLSKDFNVFLVGDATLATFPASSTPRFATNAHISFASITQLVTQVNWVQPIRERILTAGPTP